MSAPSPHRRAVLRGLLRGAAVTLALPPLEAMLNPHGTAFADGTAIPRRFGVWFFGDGVRRERWTPSRVGADWPSTDELAPVASAALKPYVSVVSGMNAMGSSYVHAGPASAVLTGTGLVHAEGDAGTPEGPSIDVIVAKQIAGNTPFAHLETGLYTFLGNGSAYQAISHNGPDAPNRAELDARKLYASLFGPGSPGAQRDGTGATLVDHVVTNRRSALDAVLADCTSLRGRLGAKDRARLDQHCESVRAIEKRLATQPTSVAACTKPDAPTNITDAKASYSLYANAGVDAALFKEVNLTMSGLIAHALACDLTRVFTHCYTNPASHWHFKTDGWDESFHVLTHDEAGDQPLVHRGVVLTMQALADTLTVFENTPIGAGNLLDYLSLLVTSDCAVGKSHDPNDYPVLLVGKAGGALKGNVHFRSNGESVTRATLTAARAAGATLDAFGTGAQRATTSVSEVLA
jgi:hypothetical protein